MATQAFSDANLRAGDRVGSMFVVGSDSDHLELKARLRSVIVWGCISAACGFFAAFGWLQLLSSTGRNVNVKFLLVLSAGCVVSLLLAGLHLGLRIRVDGRRGVIERARLIGGSTAWNANTLRAVQLFFYNAGGGNSDDCHLAAVNAEGESSPQIAVRRVDKNDSANLIIAAAQISRLLKIPIEVEGETKKACQPFTEALTRLRQPS